MASIKKIRGRSEGQVFDLFYERDKGIGSQSDFRFFVALVVAIVDSIFRLQRYDE